MRWLIHITAWERVSLARRILLALARVALGLVAAGLLLELLAPPVTTFFTARSLAKKFPEVRVVPQPLADRSVSSTPATPLSYFGYEFDMPDQSTFTAKGTAGFVQLRFASGQNVTFLVPANQSGLLSEISEDPALHLGGMQPAFGEIAHESAYDQFAELLGTTPEGVHAFGPRGRASRQLSLLFVKATAIGPGLPTGAFSFQFGDKRGFQIGDPQKSNRVDLEVFGLGGHHVEIFLSAGKNNASLAQPEINRILTTLRLSAAATPAAVAANTAREAQPPQR